MSESGNNYSRRNSSSRPLLYPLRFAMTATSELLYSVKEIWGMLIPSVGGGRRNREFEKAGKDSQKVTKRRVNVAAFRKGERERKLEIIQAERESRRFMNSSGVQAAKYREQLNQRKLEYSRGEAVHHLAMVNARYRQVDATDESSDSSKKKQPR